LHHNDAREILFQITMVEALTEDSTKDALTLSAESIADKLVAMSDASRSGTALHCTAHMLLGPVGCYNGRLISYAYTL
jgi:GR25 family glycosyltransferase involved in LPS biosynthesis